MRARWVSSLRTAARKISARLSGVVFPELTPAVLGGLVADAIRSRRHLLAENAFLRQQLIVANRSVKRPALRHGTFITQRAVKQLLLPLLLMSEASLADLNQRLTRPVEMRRFRPNLVISGCEPYAEDGFATLRIGGLTFRGVKRCVVTTIDPDTAEHRKEPLRTLSHYRLDDGQVWLGMNLIHDGCGSLRLGDAVIA